jgi:hypothetical protein
MMDDQDLEARLTTYRPAGPPPSLRARIVGEPAAGAPVAQAFRPARPRSAWAWLPAAAAMLLAATLYWLAAEGRDRIFAQLPPPPGASAADLNLEAQP